MEVMRLRPHGGYSLMGKQVFNPFGGSNPSTSAMFLKGVSNIQCERSK